LHKGTLISTNIVNLNYYRAITINPDCLGEGWIHLHIFLNLANYLASQGVKNITVTDILVQQQTGKAHHTMPEFADLFITKFLLTLERSTHDNLDLEKFKENFFKLNIKARLFCLGEGLDYASFCRVFRLVLRHFPLSPLDKVHFFLANIGLRGLVHLMSLFGRRQQAG